MAVTTSVRVVDAGRLRATVAGMFRAVGLADGEATFMGECLVDADLRGVHSHGTRYAVSYARGMQSGSINPHPTMQLVRDRHATGLLDADRAMGHIAARRAMELAIEKARVYGVGTVAVRNSTHCGALAYFTQLAADAGCIGFASTNAGSRMIPWGGRDPIIQLNPLSWAAPTDRPWSINLDMATSVAAGSKITMAIERGEKIPLGWALDADGNPTDDPAEALKGVMLPVGGPKGYGLSVCLDLITGIQAGGRFGKGLGGPGAAHVLQANDIEAFRPLDEFRADVGRIIDQIKGSALAPGSEGIFLPGEIEWNRQQERVRSGIPLTAIVVEGIEQAARELGVETALDV